MASFLGTAAVITFAGVTINTYYRKAKSDESIALVDKTAGADTHMSHLAALRETKFTVDFVMDGTTVWDALIPGTSSAALIWGPEGSTSGKPKYTATAIVAKRTKDETYNDLVVASVEFELQTAWVATSYP
ncbi:hypothetical protein UFOVP505_49 [uncultured Caudovirales phage]|uniref:Uncharacterized protein n=1 Tax=uncultured Caudovirales phage TaxID=2100421 RepID=A0A6J5MP11_9CAUD|nr:hypothetical protein UFOVP505_49 [uncultured Caudovirales phage]